MSAYTTRVRTARKPHSCINSHRIAPGEVYLEHKEFPGADTGYADTAGHPVRMAECSACASRRTQDDES